MADVYFTCLGCQQSLVADERGAGVAFRCPHCGASQIIPPTPANGAVPPAPEDGIVAGGVRAQIATTDAGLWMAQKRLWQNEQQTAEQAVAIVERDQRISALRAECDWISAQLAEERQRRQAIEPEFDLARGEWAAAEKRASEYEAGYHHTSTRLRQSEITIEELSRQLELVKTERSEAVFELTHHQEAFAELNLELEKVRAERAELEQILGRARAKLDRTSADLAAAESIVDESAAETTQLKATLANLRIELDLAATERDKFQAIVSEDHDLSELLDAKTGRDRYEFELRETQGRLDGMSEKIETLTAERDILRRERTELQLKVAAMREAHDDSQLQQDNEILRRMVERLNEQLKDAQPDIAKRKRRAATGGVVGGLARAAIARCFIPDGDVVEGR